MNATTSARQHLNCHPTTNFCTLFSREYFMPALVMFPYFSSSPNTKLWKSSRLPLRCLPQPRQRNHKSSRSTPTRRGPTRPPPPTTWASAPPMSSCPLLMAVWPSRPSIRTAGSEEEETIIIPVRDIQSDVDLRRFACSFLFKCERELAGMPGSLDSFAFASCWDNYVDVS